MRATLAHLAAALVSLLLARPDGAEPQITGFRIAVDGNQVVASLQLRGGFNHRFAQRVESGLPTPILYRFELDLDRKNWWDRRLRACTLELVAMYDAETRLYTVHFRLDDKLIESRTLRDLRGAEATMTRIERLPIFNLEDVPDTQRLSVKVRAELGTRTILSLIPVDVTTDWVESTKFHPPQRP
jgi:hypothetical protein